MAIHPLLANPYYRFARARETKNRAEARFQITYTRVSVQP
jgi:hypothetical protein